MLNSAYINLNHLVYNAKQIKNNLPKSTLFYAVVKADAYGHGLSMCANALHPIVDGFCVALKEEAIGLRLSGVDKEILLLVPNFKGETRELIEKDITLSVFKKEHLIQVEKCAKKLSKVAKVHVIFDSGMKRLGVETVNELIELINFSKKLAHVKITGLFSHFAMPENDFLRQKALEKFMVAKKIIKDYNKNAIVHISASGGFLKGVYLDAVRIGLLLYGYTPFKCEKFPLKRVMKIYAPVVNTKQIKKGESCLYGSIKSQKDLNLKIVRYGYADGLFRKPIKGQFNNRCMDLTAVKAKGKYVCIMDNADKLARFYTTISYEILTKAAIRAEKIYIR